MTTRKEELLKVKKIIKSNIEEAHCGIYSSRNLVGDIMAKIFNGEYFTLDICYGYSYFELFGTTKEEWAEIKEYYKKLLEGRRKIKYD